MREKFSNKSEFISAKEHMYFSLICPIVQNKKKTIKIQCNHANNSRLRNLFVRILFLLLFNGDRGMKSLKENSCCGFVVAVLQSCVAWIFFFSKCSKKPTVKSVLQIFLLHDWYGELLMFHSRGFFKWQWMFLVLPKKFTLLKIIQNCHSNIFKQLRYIIFKQIQKVLNIEY